MSDAQRGPVLIGYDGYDDAAAAIRGAGALLGPRPAFVAYVWESLAALLLHADVEQLTGSMREAAEEFDAGEEARAREVAAKGAKLAVEAGFDAQPISMRGRPKVWPALLQLADEHEVAAIVVGSEGLGAARSALLGSVCSGLMHRSPHPVVVVPRASESDADGPLLLGYDGSEHARLGIEAAAAVLGPREAIVQTVWTSYEAVVGAGDIGMPAAMAAAGAQRLDEELAENAKGTAEEGAALATAGGMRARAEAVQERGNVCHTLIDAAKENAAAAIVIGSRGRSSVSAALLGSVAAGLAHHSPFPLVVVPGHD